MAEQVLSLKMPQLALIQARSSSQRLPGKVLREVAGKPMLQYLVERLRRCSELNEIAVATSDRPEDDAVAGLSDRLGIRVFRGDLNDVLGRFVNAATEFGASAVVRVNGDSPLLDQALVDRGVRYFATKNVDLVSNAFPRSFPAGQSVEVVSVKVLRAIASVTQDSQDREHVTRFIYRHPDQFRVYNFSSSRDLSAVTMAVDTMEDWNVFADLVGRMTRPHWEYDLDELLQLRRHD